MHAQPATRHPSASPSGAASGLAFAATLEPVRFGEFLRDRSLISEEQWIAALAQHWSAPNRRRIGDTIVAAGFLPAHVVEAEARTFHEDLEIVEISDVVPRSERTTLPLPARA